MTLWTIEGIYFLVIVIALICIAARGIPIGTLMIFGVLYFQAIVVYLVVENKFSIAGILSMDNIIYDLFINPLIVFDSALLTSPSVGFLELTIFGLALLYICYKMIYNNLKQSIQKKYAFLAGLVTFGLLFILILGGGMPNLLSFTGEFLVENIIFIIITIILIAVILFILKGTNWILKPKLEQSPKEINLDELASAIQRELNELEQIEGIQRRKRVQNINRYE